MSKDVSSIMREVAEKIKNLDFSKLAEYLIAKKEMGVSSKLLTAALTENIHLLGEKIKSESTLMYVSFLFKLEQAKVIPNRLEFFRATLPIFVEAVSKKKFHFIALVEFLCKYKLLGELKLLMKALKKVESLPFKSAGEILHVIEGLMISLDASGFMFIRVRRELRLSIARLHMQASMRFILSLTLLRLVFLRIFLSISMFSILWQVSL